MVGPWTPKLGGGELGSVCSRIDEFFEANCAFENARKHVANWWISGLRVVRRRGSGLLDIRICGYKLISFLKQTRPTEMLQNTKQIGRFRNSGSSQNPGYPDMWQKSTLFHLHPLKVRKGRSAYTSVILACRFSRRFFFSRRDYGVLV